MKTENIESIESYLALWVSVIELAIKDLKSKDLSTRRSAKFFFQNKNSSFPWICDNIGLDAGAIRKKILLSDFV